MRLFKLLSGAKLLKRSIKSDKISLRLLATETQCCDVSQTEICCSGGTAIDVTKKALVLGVYECNKQICLTRIGEEINQICGGKISKCLNDCATEIKLGKSFIVTDVLPEYSAVAITSFGVLGAGYNECESLDEARENMRWGIGAGVRHLLKRGCHVIEVDTGTAADAAAEAAELACWRFDFFKSQCERKACCTVEPFDKCDEALWLEGIIRAQAQNWARFLSDMPANRMTPVDIAQAAIDVLCPLGIDVEAHDREWVMAQRMEAFLAVARGSCEEPIFLEVSYRGAHEDMPPILIAAKGITFDSGGLCLKKCSSMTENRGSMAGAAVALATIKAIAELRVPINVNLVIPLCENMVSGQCMKVGDVVKALNGLSIQIEHTDYEGRLMMADALVYGQTLYKPSLVIDVATFTRGVLMATGGGAFGCFSNSTSAWQAVRCAGAITGDRPWRFPLWQYYKTQITNDPSVDLRNKGSGHATPCLGAAFLRNFICGDWIHMDITGVGKVAHHVAPPYLDPRRMTGRPCRTLIQLLLDISRNSQTAASQCTNAPPCC